MQTGLGGGARRRQHEEDRAGLPTCHCRQSLGATLSALSALFTWFSRKHVYIRVRGLEGVAFVRHQQLT